MNVTLLKKENSNYSVPQKRHKRKVESKIMTSKQFNEQELKEILKIAQEGEVKLKQMSDNATIIAEKWRIKTNTLPTPLTKTP